ncbi:hypothetical protein Q5P01_017630 [Channa striata]|uniref:Uncharacterized protein n=1 Tax=Channa striata TaxID=64152 RepID=A0AA88MDU5_CHASR|nr:hypothetical protein Q5P01_017630 [Channa striata]
MAAGRKEAAPPSDQQLVQHPPLYLRLQSFRRSPQDRGSSPTQGLRFAARVEVSEPLCAGPVWSVTEVNCTQDGGGADSGVLVLLKSTRKRGKKKKKKEKTDHRITGGRSSGGSRRPRPEGAAGVEQRSELIHGRQQCTSITRSPVLPHTLL